MNEIEGYLRQDGKIGIRNYIEVVYCVECASHVAREIALYFRDLNIQYFGFSGCYPTDYGYRLMKGMCTNPNVGAVILVSLGCENFDSKALEKEIRDSGRLVKRLVIQELGGTQNAINEGISTVINFTKELLEAPRCPMSLSDLVVGTICGGSDGTSVITGNPTVGKAFDRLLSAGATCIFEESGELIGCEQLMAERAVNEEVRLALLDEMAKCRHYYDVLGFGSFSNGNAVGGLTTQEEKSLGAYAKSGSSKIQGIVKPGVCPPRNGLYLMDVIPDGEVRFGYPNICDSAEACELTSCGCHMIVFTTGRGSTIGSVIAPVVKVCCNPETYERMSSDMDVNAGRIISDGAGLDEMAQELIDVISAAASGHKTKSESLGHAEYVLTYKAYDYSKGIVCGAH